MAVNLKGRDFLKIKDFSTEELQYLLDLSRKLKEDKLSGCEAQNLKGKNIVLLFQKDSTRTRCAFECGAHDQGAHVTYIGPSGSHMGTKESIADTARVLSRMFDGIEFRGFSQDDVEELAENSYVPVYNGLTDEWHPTQMLADYLTIQEEFGRNLKGRVFTYMGDGHNNMAHSYIVMGAKMGIEMRLGCPKEQWPEQEVIDYANEVNKETGGKLIITEDPIEAAKDADIITTDVWVSMGESKDLFKERIELLKPYQVNDELVKHCKEDYIFLHCLPAFHNDETATAKDVIEHVGFGKDGMEVTDSVFESKHSRAFQEAENRLHTIKAVMVATIGSQN